MSKKSGRMGADYERECMVELVKEGFVAVRSAGSRGPIDVVGIGPQTIRLIQVTKVGQDLFNRRDALLQVPAPPNAIREIWIRRPYRPWSREVLDV